MPYVYLTAALALSTLAVFAPIPCPPGFEATSPVLMVVMSLLLFWKGFARSRASA